MPAVRTTFRSQNHRGRPCRDSQALAVAFSWLQLMAIAFVWLMALIPLTLIALGATMLRAVRPVFFDPLIPTKVGTQAACRGWRWRTGRPRSFG